MSPLTVVSLVGPRRLRCMGSLSDSALSAVVLGILSQGRGVMVGVPFIFDPKPALMACDYGLGINLAECFCHQDAHYI